MDNKLRPIQIHHDANNHWVCSTYDNNLQRVLLYDSLNKKQTTMELDTQLALIYATDAMQLSVTVPRIQTQKGGYDCGLFAFASATCIAAGIDPMTQTWDQTAMRAHCIQCIKSGIASPFPSSTRGLRTGRLPQPRQFIIDLICDCNLPEYAYNSSKNEGSARAVQCDGCNFWFHNYCYGLPDSSVNDPFLCRSCY